MASCSSFSSSFSAESSSYSESSNMQSSRLVYDSAVVEEEKWVSDSNKPRYSYVGAMAIVPNAAASNTSNALMPPQKRSNPIPIKKTQQQYNDTFSQPLTSSMERLGFNNESDYSPMSWSGRDASMKMAMKASSQNVKQQPRLSKKLRERIYDSERELALREDPAYENRLKQDFLLLTANVNGQDTEILIDTGAQHSVMSTAWMKACRLHKLLDRREAGVCLGVGSAEIYGKIWRVPCVLNGRSFNITVNVMDMDELESPLILGLDFLTKYKCNLNVRARKLEFPTFHVKCSSKKHDRVWK